jgi:hypothetical protein
VKFHVNKFGKWEKTDEYLKNTPQKEVRKSLWSYSVKETYLKATFQQPNVSEKIHLT